MSRFVAPPPAPSTLSNDPRTPYNCDVRLRNLVHNTRVLHIVPWMQEATFDQVVEMWFYAQSIKVPGSTREHSEEMEAAA